MSMTNAKMRRTFGTALDEAPTSHSYVIVCIKGDGDQLVCHGYRSLERAELEIKDRVRLCSATRGMKPYRRFVIIESDGTGDTMYVYDQRGLPVAGRFIATIVAEQAALIKREV